MIAKSLRTRDPGTARMIGTQVTGIAVVLRRGVRCGTMTFEQAETEIEAFLAQFPFSVDPDVIESLKSRHLTHPGGAAASSLAYSPAQETAMLADFARRVAPILVHRAEEVRTRPTFVLDGIRTDWVADAVRQNRIQAEVCRLLVF